MSELTGNSAPTAKKKPRGKPFAKGQSGNPNGRPKENPELKAAAREYTQEALETLAYWMRHKQNPGASVAATKELLNRGYGMPSQDVNMQASGSFNVIVRDFPDAPPIPEKFRAAHGTQ